MVKRRLVLTSYLDTYNFVKSCDDKIIYVNWRKRKLANNDNQYSAIQVKFLINFFFYYNCISIKH